MILAVALMATAAVQAQMPVLDFSTTSAVAEYENEIENEQQCLPAIDISRINAMNQEAMKVAEKAAEKEAEEELQRQLRKAKPITGGEDMPLGEGLLALIVMAVVFSVAIYLRRRKTVDS